MTRKLVDEVRLSGPRLAIRVVELMKNALRLNSEGLSQRDLSERLGVTESRVSQLLNGDGNVRVSTLARVFTALGYRVDVLVTDRDGLPLEVQSRRRGRVRKPEPQATYSHPVIGESGTMNVVYSFSPVSHAGKPVDFPMKVSPESVKRPFSPRIVSDQKSIVKEWELAAN